MTKKRVIIAGATGMVGGITLRRCLCSPDVETITVIGRRVTGIVDPKMCEVLHSDFTDYAPVSEAFQDQDVALFCIGTYTGSVPDDELRKVTVDYALAFGRQVREQSPQASFCFLSGQGADHTERSRMAFARYKGIAEKALLEMGFERTHIFRPGYIYPVTRRQEPNTSYRIFRKVYPVVRRVYPNIGLASDDLATAMVYAGLHGTRDHKSPILENKDIRALAKQIS